MATARNGAQPKPQTVRKPSRPTPYVVMRKRLDLGGEWSVLIGGFEIVGFSATTNKRAAIRKVAGSLDDAGPLDNFAAVPVRSLTLYLADGTLAAEQDPEARS